MQISHSNTPSFKSNIKFVDMGKFTESHFDNYFYCAYPNRPLQESMVAEDSFWTSSVKSCTAGGVVGEDESLGFHFYDCSNNILRVLASFVDAVKEKVTTPKSALLLGSKVTKNAPDSVPLFEAVERETNNLVTPSVFKTYANKYAESDIGYEKETDTWYINTYAPKNPMMITEYKEISSVDDLKSMFKSIKIAPQDKLFIGDEEVSRAEHPELFI